MKTRGNVRKMTAATLALILFMTILAGCSFGGGSKSKEENRVLRIATMYGDSSNYDYLRTQYTDIFEFNNDHIEIEFVAAIDYNNRHYNSSEEPERLEPIEEMKKLLEGPNPPDLVLISLEEFETLVNDNMLQPLDPMIQDDKFDLSDFAPLVIDGLKAMGNNKLYGLAPTFYSSALVYNQDLFIDAGVEYPVDNMTWDQVFALAKRVSDGLSSSDDSDRKYGFSFSSYMFGDLFYDMSLYVSPLQLNIVDENSERMTVDSDQWEQVWKDLIQLKNDKIIPETPDWNDPDFVYPTGPYSYDALLSGKVAMTIISYGQINEIINANNNAATIEGFEPITWDVVTFPSHPEFPDVGGSVGMDPLMGINAKAANTKDAWEFIKFINGEKWAQLKSRSTYNLMSRMSYIEPKDGLNYNINAFTAKLPSANQHYLFNPIDASPHIQRNFWQITNLGQQKFNEVLNGEKEVRLALKEWATEGDALLQQFKENPDEWGGDIGIPLPMPMEEVIVEPRM